MKRLLAVILAFSVNAYGAAVIPNIFATQPSGNVPASYLDVDFALVSNYNTFSNYLVDSGAANAYVVTFPAGTTGSLAAGLLINFKAGADNTGASTLAANGMTAKNITNYDASALAAGQIKAGAIVSVIYDGTQFKLAGQPGGVSPSFLTPQATNTVLGNATSGSAAPTALAVGTCSTAASALIWTTNTGFGCNTSITANTAGTVTTAAQPNITSVGTLTGLTSSGLITSTVPGGNFLYSSSGGTSASYERITNTGDTAYWGVDSSVGGNIISGTAPYATVLGVLGAHPLQLGTNNTVRLTVESAGGVSVDKLNDSGAHLIISSTAPTIASGFGTSPSIVANNTAAFQVTVGSGGTDFSGVITMPAAPNGWVCQASEVLSVSNSHIIKQYDTGTETTQIGLVNFNSQSGATTPFAIGATIRIICMAF